MPYPSGKPTRTEQRIAWIMDGKQGPDPWPRCTTAAQREVRAEIDRLEKQLKVGRYAPRVRSAAEIEAIALRKRLRRQAVIQSGFQRIRTGPTSMQAIAEDWIMRGKPEGEPVPQAILNRQANNARQNAKQAKLRALARGGKPQVQGGGRPDMPLDALAGARLLVWFTIWDACVVPDEYKADDVRYGIPTKVDWQRVPSPGCK